MNRGRAGTSLSSTTRTIPHGTGPRIGKFSLAVTILLILLSFVVSIPISGDSTAITPTKLPGLPDDGKFNYVTLADVDKNGYPDMVAGAGGYPGDSPGGLHLYLNDGGSSFTESSDGLSGPGDNYFGSAQVVDVDGDGNMDIVAAYESRWSGGESGGIGIWLGSGGAEQIITWTEAVSPTVSGSYDSAHCADIDGDGNMDIVGGSSNGLHAWLGGHSGSTLSWTEANDGLPASGEYTGVTLGDMDGDDNPDIVAGSYDNRGISVYLYGGIGSLKWTDGHTGTSLKHNGNTFDNRLIDLNGDSKLDLVSTIRGGIKAYVGNGNSGIRSTWWTEVSDGLPTSDDHYQLAVDDVDGDGKMDICSNFQVWSNSGSMTDTSSFSWEQLDLGIHLNEPVGIAVGDVNNDGRKDIAGCGWDSGVVCYVLEPDSGGTPAPDKFYIRGTVSEKDDGIGVWSATVDTDDNGGYSTTTNANGDYELYVRKGEYELTVVKKGYVESTKTVSVNGENVTLDFQLVETTAPGQREYEVSGTVRDIETDDPIPGVLIEVLSEGSTAGSDSSGAYSLSLSNGSFTVTFSMDGYEEETVPVKVRGKNIVEDVTLKAIPEDDGDGGGVSVIFIVAVSAVAFCQIVLIVLIVWRRK